MCGRYGLFQWDESLSGVAGFPAGQEPAWSWAPGAMVLLLHHDKYNQPQITQARWGLTPSSATDFSRTPAQARAETIATQPMFRQAFQKRRGVMPANGFYEWRGGMRKQPFWMTVPERIVYFAAIWEPYPVMGKTWYSCAVVTTAAADQRRPVILSGDALEQWLDPNTPESELLALLSSSTPELRERPLATWVNDPLLNTPQCLTPL